MGLELLTALFVVHLVSDARSGRGKPSPTLAVAFEISVFHELLERLQCFLELAEPLKLECFPLRAGHLERQRVHRGRMGWPLRQFRRVICDPGPESRFRHFITVC